MQVLDPTKYFPFQLIMSTDIAPPAVIPISHSYQHGKKYMKKFTKWHSYVSGNQQLFNWT